MLTTPTNLNVRTDKSLKLKSEKIFKELGINMTTAINMFLRATVRENGIPFDLKLDEPNKTTINAIQEGEKVAEDKNVKGCHNIEELKRELLELKELN